MAHFAQLNDSNVVLTVNVIADADCLDGDDNELPDINQVKNVLISLSLIHI